MMVRHMLLTAAALSGAALFLGSCNDDDEDLVQPFVVEVSARDDFFDPKVDTVHVGTTVQWVNRGTHLHTTDSDTGLWDAELDPGERFSFTFDQLGSFPYHCDIHGAIGGVGMSGVIVVIQ